METFYELQSLTYRGKEYSYIYIGFRDRETGHVFTTGESDQIGLDQVTNQYRIEHGIPFLDEIVSIRQKYGLSASGMSEILGFGTNQWRRYEQGEVPSESNGKMIRSVMNPKVMLDLVEHSRGELSEKEYARIVPKIKAVIEQREQHRQEEYAIGRLYATPRCADNGFAPQSPERLKNLLLAILERCGSLFYTQMNKILFYIDFLSYRERGMAISGLSYRAIEFGPIPNRYERVYSGFDEIEPTPKMIGEVEGTILNAGMPADMSFFTEEEQAIIEQVCNRFKGLSSRQLSDISHQEEAWKKYHENKEGIPFAEAFTLSAF